jgi:hypothetical protein
MTLSPKAVDDRVGRVRHRLTLPKGRRWRRLERLILFQQRRMRDLDVVVASIRKGLRR